MQQCINLHAFKVVFKLSEMINYVTSIQIVCFSNYKKIRADVVCIQMFLKQNSFLEKNTAYIKGTNLLRCFIPE